MGLGYRKPVIKEPEDGYFCPLRSYEKYGGSRACRKEKCQWWAGGHGCIVHVIARALCDIRDRTSV